MAQVLCCCEACRGAKVLVFIDDETGEEYFEPCSVCGGEGDVWAEEPRWEPRIMLDEVAAELQEEDAP